MKIVRQNGKFWDIEDNGKTRKVSDSTITVLELRNVIENIGQKEYFIGEAIRETEEYISFAEDMAEWAENEMYSIVKGVCFAGKRHDIKELVVPVGAHTIKSHSFRGFTLLESVFLPETLKIIEPFAFCGCENLSTLELPPNLEELYDSAFCGTKIEQFKVPNSLKRLSGNPFLSGAEVYISGSLARDVSHAFYMLTGVRLKIVR